MTLGKKCPACGGSFPSEKVVCPTDRTLLIPDFSGDTSAAQRLMVGQTVDGKYELLQQLSANSVERIFIARHKLIDKQVRIKFLASSDPSEVGQFQAKVMQQASRPDAEGAPLDFGVTGDDMPYVVFSI